MFPARAGAGSSAELLCVGLGHVSLPLPRLKASRLTAVQMVPSGSREMHEKWYPIKEGAGWPPAFAAALFGEGIVAAAGKYLT